MRMTSSPSPGPGRRSAPRVLRVEYNGMPYDWLNLDEMGPRVAHSEQFVATLRENIVRYFKVPVECQVCCDEDGPLVSAWDFLRVLQSVSPFVRIFDTREMPGDVKMQVSKKLAAIQTEVAKLQDGLGFQRDGGVSPWRGNAGASYTSGSTWGTPQRAVSPAPARETMQLKPASPMPGYSPAGLAPSEPSGGFGARTMVTEPVVPRTSPWGGFGAGAVGAEPALPQTGPSGGFGMLQTGPAGGSFSSSQLRADGAVGGSFGASPAVAQSGPAGGGFSSSQLRADGAVGGSFGAGRFGAGTVDSRRSSVSEPEGSRDLGGARVESAGVPGVGERVVSSPGQDLKTRLAEIEKRAAQELLEAVDEGVENGLAWSADKGRVIGGTAAGLAAKSETITGDQIRGSSDQPGSYDKPTYEVNIQRSGLQKYGFGIQPTLDEKAGIIDRIDSDGILARWNMTNPQQRVEVGDMLLSVNGVSDNLGDMEQELRTPELRMLFRPR